MTMRKTWRKVGRLLGESLRRALPTIWVVVIKEVLKWLFGRGG